MRKLSTCRSPRQPPLTLLPACIRMHSRRKGTENGVGGLVALGPILRMEHDPQRKAFCAGDADRLNGAVVRSRLNGQAGRQVIDELAMQRVYHDVALLKDTSEQTAGFDV